ncbi:hypothetical protein [Fusobacterium necrophorum]|uniref:Uncharacterized protein n=1 Tax=Fusobacterium necrophorum subsp. funduliforme TaxID=143387 RepID=A0A162J949_9FUSO|nr:hypothetical protein [Fusobacterium necrophorum]AVQ21529.1 hypothetical protein C4N15_07635 [Fusobacterium necrophorum subsp. funduliforme]KYL05366.1 hypothetical protein A2J07_01100 [Fusobacterium necrophorum subsp. funduliforme]
MKKIEFLFNILLEKNITFEKTFFDEYILYDFLIILTEKKTDKRLEEYFKRGFESFVFPEGYISSENLQKIIGEDLREYEYFVF